jgi:hypothetical protein
MLRRILVEHIQPEALRDDADAFPHHSVVEASLASVVEDVFVQ